MSAERSAAADGAAGGEHGPCVLPLLSRALLTTWQEREGTRLTLKGQRRGQPMRLADRRPGLGVRQLRLQLVEEARVQSVYKRDKSGAKVSIWTKTGMRGTKMLCVRKGQKLDLKGAGTFVRSHTWKC
ncbi:hypothetical protein ABZX68_02290 [Streptomyces cellulosae]